MNRQEMLERDYEEYKAKGKIWGVVRQERISLIKFPRIKKEIIDQFMELDDLTSTISDVMDSLGIAGAVSATHVKPLIPGKKVVGTAVTLRNIPERMTATQGYVAKRFDDIRMATKDMYYLSEPGDVLVVDGGGSPDISHIGGQSCTVAKACQMAGTVVDGCIRDIDTIRKLDYPIWSKGITPITGKFRIEAIEINGPVRFHNIQVIPGDLVVADETGICFVPADKVEDVLNEVKRIIKLENDLTVLVDKSAPLDEIRKVYKQRYK